ncbi:Poly [ADP-ribose] polymerase 14 [Nibea albiflora]|uniref:Poly [ADP-ribose] polymerase 14 n=1 Tax=Nibea albiflora TaxID=240163 RepID=A0ACB7EG28_NIBAL|nr:Poly [ADP-ribose] polymerase 14 [Nibea albiflora]
MADAYMFALLVEIGENDTPRLKNKLVKYFQSKKSNGGDCVVDYENGSRTALLRFRTEEDRQNVLAKEAHQISLDTGVLKMTVRLTPDDTKTQEPASEKFDKKSAAVSLSNQQSSTEPTPAAEVQTVAKGADNDSADEEPCASSAVLGNIQETVNPEFFEMLVENILKDPDTPSASQTFTLEVIPDMASVVVTFQSGKECTNFVTKCPKNRTFTKKKFSVQPLQVTDQVVVEDLQDTSEDLLRLYFENVGGDVENVELNEGDQSAIITFKEYKAVQKAVVKKHHIKQNMIRVYPFYKSLGTALYGKDKPSLKLPAAISEPIDSGVWRYLNDNQPAAKTIHSQLAKHFCDVNLKQPTVRLSPVPSLLQQKDAKAIIKEWGGTVKLAFTQALSQFKSLKFQLESEAWKESEEKIRQTLLNENVAVVPDEAGMGPTFDRASPQKSLAQLKRAVKGSLELAEKNGCVSVALPAISRSQGFPLQLCADTIVKAVKDHYDDMYDDNTLKKIHFVNNDDIVVQAMEAAVKQLYGNHVSHSQQTPTQVAIPLPVQAAGADSNCLGKVTTKEGVNVTLTKGNIEHATTEVTVNTVFEDLALNRGAVSSAIFRVAGPKLQEFVTAKNTSGAVGEIIVTEGCMLKSSQVFHAVTPHWDKGQGTAEKILSGIFKDCLDKAEDIGLTSISFPAIGTGNLGFPKDIVASLMLDKIVEFSSKKQPKHLKKVVIILYTGDAPTIQVFSDEFKKKFPNASGVPVATSSPQSQGPFTKVTSTSGMHETKMGSVVIQVVTGDITKETTDVIVNSSNESFSLKSGVSKAILDGAGPAVEAECQTLGAQANTGMIMTQPGNLKCKKILHLAGQTDLVKINKVVKEALQMCVKNSHTSVSFPAIGTGQGNVQAKQVADAMLDAVIDVLSQNTSSTLKTIRIVIFQPPMLKEFYNSMHQRETPDPKNQAGFWGNIGSKIKSLFVGTADKPQKEGDFVIEPLKVDPACFHICGDSRDRVDKAKQWINDLISKEQHIICIKDSNILTLSDASHKRIVDIQKTLCVSIKTESKKTNASITIEGLCKDVLEASSEIHDMLRKVRDEEDLKKKVELAGTVAEWQYQQTGFQFQSFNSMTNYELEQALEKELQSVKVTVQGQDYTVTMPNGPATDNQGRTLQIKRIDKLKDDDVPEFWDTMPPNTSSLAVDIKAGTAEYTEIEKLFKATCGQPIIKIERIQNPVLWKSLQLKKHDMEQRNGHQKNEKRLFHGTCQTTVPTINEHGFNRSYAGKNAACYGNGTYFAVNASYSAQGTYSKPNAAGEKFMYVCRVLTGDFTAGQKGMVAPPSKGAVSVQLYDSVVDNMGNPSMFIVFHDTQAYPEYLIKFK